MKSYSLFLVKNSALNEAQQPLGHTEPVAGTSWVRYQFTKDADPPDDEILTGEASLTESLSETLGEVIFVYGDTSIDGFVYEHADQGEMLRKLVWFPMLDDEWNAGWIFVDGQPESWEQILFKEDRLASYLERLRAQYADEGHGESFDRCAQQVQEDWATGEIHAGNRYPECDGTMALVIESHYGVERAAERKNI